MRSSVLISFLMLVSAPSYGANCGDISPQELHVIPAPAYWFAAADDRYVMFNKADDKPGSFAYDFRGKKIVRVSDMIDAFPTSNGELFIVPHPFRIIRTNEAIKLGSKAKPLYVGSTSEDGEYPTVGVQERAGQKFLRVVAETGAGLILNEYDISDLESKKKISKTNAQAIPLCRNLGKRFVTLPIVSRDGTMISASVHDSNTTQIFEIEMPSGNCRQIVDLKVKTSKTAFSFDGTKIAYRVQANGSQQLVEFDLKSKKSTVLVASSGFLGHQAYRPDGSLIFSQSSQGKSELIVLPPNASSLCAPSQTQLKAKTVQ